MRRIWVFISSITIIGITALAIISTMVITSAQGTSGNMTVVSSMDCLVTYSTSGGIFPRNAEIAWQPYNPSNNHWDINLTYEGNPFSFANGAQWIWDSYRVTHPETGDIAFFEKSFNINGLPTAGEIYITCDNAYELYLNNAKVGDAQLSEGWSSDNLTEPYVKTTGWQTIEHWDISSYLKYGLNILEIKAANEYMGPADGQGKGTVESNPAGLIFEASIDYEIIPYSDDDGHINSHDYAVGITVMPVDKTGLLIPWLGSAGIMLLVTGAGSLVVRRRRNHF